MKTDDPTKVALEICSVQPIDLTLLKNLWKALYPPLPTITTDEKEIQNDSTRVSRD